MKIPEILEDWNTYRGIKYFMVFEIVREWSTEVDDYLKYKIWLENNVDNMISGYSLLCVNENIDESIIELQIDENDEDSIYLDLLTDLKRIFPPHFRLKDFGCLFEDFNYRLNKLIEIEQNDNTQ